MERVSPSEIADPTFSLSLPLSRDFVHVVKFPLDIDGGMADMASVLDGQERDRATRFVQDCDRRRFVVAHVLMRLVLARCLQVPAASLRFSIGAHGKPGLVGADVDLRFNLSHAGERALLGVALGREVGIDIEQERPVEALSIARRYFSPAEYQVLASLPEERRTAAFFRGWTRKESFIKARGDGLLRPLDGFDVSLENTAPQLLLGSRDSPSAPDQWTMVAVAVDAGYAGAITAEGKGWRLAYCDVA